MANLDHFQLSIDNLILGSWGQGLIVSPFSFVPTRRRKSRVQFFFEKSLQDDGGPLCLLDGRKEGYQEGVDAAAAGLKKKMRGRVNERVCVRVRACVWV